jgi:hypothetical protein
MSKVKEEARTLIKSTKDSLKDSLRSGPKEQQLQQQHQQQQQLQQLRPEQVPSATTTTTTTTTVPTQAERNPEVKTDSMRVLDAPLADANYFDEQQDNRKCGPSPTHHLEAILDEQRDKETSARRLLSPPPLDELVEKRDEEVDDSDYVDTKEESEIEIVDEEEKTTPASPPPPPHTDDKLCPTEWPALPAAEDPEPESDTSLITTIKNFVKDAVDMLPVIGHQLSGKTTSNDEKQQPSELKDEHHEMLETKREANVLGVGDQGPGEGNKKLAPTAEPTPAGEINNNQEIKLVQQTTETTTKQPQPQQQESGESLSSAINNVAPDDTTGETKKDLVTPPHILTDNFYLDK